MKGFYIAGEYVPAFIALGANGIPLDNRDGSSPPSSGLFPVGNGEYAHGFVLVDAAGNPQGSMPPAGPPPPAIPVSTVAPVVSGSAPAGSLLTTTNGTWTNTPLSYAYQWQNDGIPIGGATVSTYTTVTADGGHNVSCQVTATNAVGSASAVSNNIAVFSTWNPADKAASITLSGGNLIATGTLSGPNAGVRGTRSRTTGKYHYEITINAAFSVADAMSGFLNATGSLSNFIGGDAGGVGLDNESGVGNLYTNNVGTSVGTTAPVVGSTNVFEVDLTARKLWVSVGAAGVWNGNNGANNPATGLGGFDISGVTGALFPAWDAFHVGDQVTLNVGGSAWVRSPSAGFSAWG